MSCVGNLAGVNLCRVFVWNVSWAKQVGANLCRVFVWCVLCGGTRQVQICVGSSFGMFFGAKLAGANLCGVFVWGVLCWGRCNFV